MSTSIRLKGTIKDNVRYSHNNHSEDFFSFDLEVLRKSGTADTLPCIASKVFMNHIIPGERVLIYGEIRSRNVVKENGTRGLNIYVFVTGVLPESDDCHDENYAIIKGYICKPTVFRTTPGGRLITDFIIASNRLHGKSDYIPCIAWGRVAQMLASASVGDEFYATGRFQSRNYKKTYEDGHEEFKTTYEFSMREFKTEEEIADEHTN